MRRVSRTPRSARLFLPAAAVIAAMVLAACGTNGSGATDEAAATGQGSDTGAWLEGAGDDWNSVLDSGRKEGTVVVAGPPPVADALSAAFKKDTGIKLTYLAGDPSDLTARVTREAAAGKPSMDLWIGGGSTYDADFLVPLDKQLLLPSVTDPDNWFNHQVAWMDEDTKHNLMLSAQVGGWIVVNSDKVDPDDVKTWDDLLDPALKGKIVAADPTGHGPGQSRAAQILSAKGPQYVTDLFKGQDVTLVSDGNQLMEGLAKGQFSVAIGATASDVMRYQPDFKSLTVIQPTDAPAWLSGGYDVVKQVKGVQHPSAATVFLNWFASERGQSIYQDIMLETSRRTDVPKDKLPDFIVPKDGVDYVDTYSSDVYDKRGELADQLTKAIGGR